MRASKGGHRYPLSGDGYLVVRENAECSAIESLFSCTLFQNLVGGSGNAVGGGGAGNVVGGGGVGGGSDGLDVVLPDDGSTLDTLDDGLTGDGGGDGVGDGPGNVDGGGDLNDLLNGLDDIVGDIVGPGDLVGLVDDVGLLLDGDDGGVDLGASTEGSGDGNVEVGDGGLQDLSGVAGNIGGLAEVNLKTSVRVFAIAALLDQVAQLFLF